ncbi:hypothetical protein ACIBJF_52270 [Streptomyces sp. NPDC050743]|uniref:hypothetical protein n=1 Tax=Streptomyces sp. NPDC050743 TaxID=3365634 RepID=UPI00379BC4F7
MIRRSGTSTDTARRTAAPARPGPRLRTGTAPTLRTFIYDGQRSVEELVDHYGIKNAEIRQLLIDYLVRRKSDTDYVTLQGLARHRAGNFWSVIEELRSRYQSDLAAWGVERGSGPVPVRLIASRPAHERGASCTARRCRVHEHQEAPGVTVFRVSGTDVRLRRVAL